ncbi:sulfatase-like hydrolase/transferase [Rubellicoccus peritrichatus]|uniref:Sulfatase-like hydrolase/transferase n=1 Tax=Rubellicoccus peritrichatus TaxID=3080537 RepID=A0AAQ3LC38_9BACT|nr:sulfatase-like hydrolase/transferase [Puniceicoccus sp. CR14]WOO42597.1 sulfatase-like hydrolase/transferase [Puniceicoccus sp. CR14]
MRSARPNILFVLSDQQRWDTLGCYGQKLPVTPNLDRLAKEGTRFRYAFTPQPVCGPARSCIQSSRYATETGCFVNHRKLPANDAFLGNLMTESGYETAYIGKWHLASFGPIGGVNDYTTRPIPLRRRGGYENFWIAADALELTTSAYGGRLFNHDEDVIEIPENVYRVDAITDWGIDFLKQRKGSSPFFMTLSYLEPHHQNDLDQHIPPERFKNHFRDFTAPDDLKPDEGNWESEFADYLACCHTIDENFGRIRDYLETTGEWDNTVVVYTSDHGSHFKTRNSEYKRSCHDSSIRIPMICAGPGFKPGFETDLFASLLDLAPTFLRAADTPVPSDMRGIPLQDSTALDAEKNWRNKVFFQISESQVGRGIRTNKYKLSISDPKQREGWFLGKSSDYYEDEFFYDLIEDPHEHNNLIGDSRYESVISELREELSQFMKKIGEPESFLAGAIHNIF